MNQDFSKYQTNFNTCIENSDIFNKFHKEHKEMYQEVIVKKKELIKKPQNFEKNLLDKAKNLSIKTSKKD